MRRPLAGLSAGIFALFLSQTGHAHNTGTETDYSDSNISEYCQLDSDKVRFNVGVAEREEDGSLMRDGINRNECRGAVSLKRGMLPNYGEKRWWGVDKNTISVGCVRCGGYKDHKIIYPVTSKNGYILNVDPNEHLRKLFAEKGVVIPELPQTAVSVVVSNGTDTPYDRRHLRVRGAYPHNLDKQLNGKKFSHLQSGEIIDNVISGQRVWITDVKIFVVKEDWRPVINYYSIRTHVWAKIYSLHPHGAFIKLGQVSFVGYDNYDKEYRDLNVGREGWEALLANFPEIKEKLEGARMERENATKKQLNYSAP
ncbi:MAG: hypothetical protein HYT93_01875 [Parcubacteria group bacterium]|nr:hypothetical protein [Parcubacteria group bacterium]